MHVLAAEYRCSYHLLISLEFDMLVAVFDILFAETEIDHEYPSCAVV